ncbi:uncharacterized protein [Phyllobates terribilis]|uniref:uncharacterized protein n=1 Tax=Phyllobates terribilis TaxID=111132 RepID=UPI003CCA8E20
MPNTGAAVVLLLCICPRLSQSQEVKYIALFSDVTFNFGPCERNKVHKIHIDDVTILSPCNSSPQIPDRCEGRIITDKTTGTITLCNVIRSDAGYYRLERTNGNGIKEKLPGVEIQVLDPIWIHELFHNNTDGTISLTLCHAEDPGEIIWKIDGRDLLDQRWLSSDDRTLTIPYNYTGAITVSNQVSADNKSITLIRDRNGESGHLDHIMDLNIAREIWGDGEGEPSVGTLILPRNISTIYVLLTTSDEASEHQFHSRKHFGLFGILLVFILVIVYIYLIQ